MQRHVVIIGSGFGGLATAQVLDDPALRVTLVDRRNHHLFQPLLYQVATASLNPSSIAYPVRRIFRHQPNVTVLMAEARAVDAARKQVLLDDGALEYDDLVIATGATHSYFGKDQWAPFAPGLKSIEDALDMRRRIFTAFEEAEREEDPARRDAWLTFVVIGGGPTGVELAGALAEISRHAMGTDFRRIDPRSARILLLEGADRVLPPMHPELSQSAREQLEALGVQVRPGSLVTAIDADGVSIGDVRIPAKTVLWGAGVAASPLGKTIGAPTDRAGRVIVNPDLTVPNHPEIFVIGDLASFSHEGKPLPGVAPVAMQQGRHAGESILRRAHGQPIRPFSYVDKGSMATIGRAAAVADLRGLHLKGFLAWAAWLLVHIMFLIGFRNRFLVLVDWCWNYVLFERGARLITGKSLESGVGSREQNKKPAA